VIKLPGAGGLGQQAANQAESNGPLINIEDAVLTLNVGFLEIDARLAATTRGT
jgi:hypothetical protein